MFVSWIAFVGSFLVSDTLTLTTEVILTRDVAFNDLLPTTGNVNYMETKHCESRIECAAVCMFCAGLLYNQNTGTCHLLKARLREASFDRNRTDSGWELFNNKNGMYITFRKKNLYLYFKKAYLIQKCSTITNDLTNLYQTIDICDHFTCTHFMKN